MQAVTAHEAPEAQTPELEPVAPVRQPQWSLWPLLLLGLSLGIGSALRLWMATHDDGVFWPDEIYQGLEPAHRLIFGYGIVAWEFQEGVRNWAFPGFVALVLKGCQMLGITDPRTYVMVVRVVFCTVGVATAAATYQLARSLGAAALAAAVGASIFALSAPAIYLAPRAMSESGAALLVALGLALALPPRARSRRLVLGTALLALAVCLRLQMVIFGVGLVAVLALRSPRQPALRALATFAAGMLLFGLTDLLTWGSWFHSAISYLDANLVQGRSLTWGISPISYYPKVLLTSMGPAGLLMLGLAALGLRRSPALSALAVVFAAAHSLVPHKEFRFLLPDLPLLCAIAALGLDQLSEWAPSRVWRLLAGLVVIAALLSAATFHQLTLKQLGAPFAASRPATNAFDDPGAANRLLFQANRRGDLCGIKLESVGLDWTGGYSYLHRPVPLYRADGPSRESGKFNYVITPLARAAGAQVIAVDGDQALARISRQSCRPDPGYIPTI
jgi:phosphatidylinositol glycan class B